MILLDTAKDISQTPTSAIKLPTDTSDENTKALSFLELLRGVGSKKDEKVIQNGALVLSLETETTDKKDLKSTAKNDTLLKLLKNDTTQSKSQETPLALNPDLTQKLSNTEVKALVSDAKKYLQNQIVTSDDYKQSQIKELPKTLKGLVDVAKTIGIDINKITVEEVQVGSKKEMPKELELKTTPSVIPAKEQGKVTKDVEQKVQLSDILNSKNSGLNQEDTKVQGVVHKGEKTFHETKVQTTSVKSQQQSENFTVQNHLQKTDKTPEVKNPQNKVTQEQVLQELKKDTQVQKIAPKNEDVIQELKSQPEGSKSEKPTQSSTKNNLADLKTVKNPEDIQKTQMDEPKVQKVQHQQQAELKSTQVSKGTPLFKAQTHIDHSTQELVLTKANTTIKVDERTPKERADETLKLLLRGEKPQQNSQKSMTADFSVATAKVIAPSAVPQTSQVTQTLQQMLKGDSGEIKTDEGIPGVKSESITVAKADSFEVKVNEAKQMIKYLSNDVKTAIEDYKSPFTRVKVQLNPQNLGEIDLTVVQRGKNLHVNLSSNNAAINTLAMNINDLKVQLSNSGINNASFNFSNNQDGGNSASSQQQQQHQNEQQAHKEYNYYGDEESNEEILNSLEIVVPTYI